MTPCPDHFRAARLDGKAIIVLGAGGGGIGTATCEALAGAGARLVCVDRDQGQAEAAAKASGGIPMVADVTDRKAMEQLFAQAASIFGQSLSGIVDIVAFMRPGYIASFDDAALQSQFDVVLRHAILATQIGGRLLRENGGGTIAFVGSMSGEQAAPKQSIYGIAKAALHHLIRSAANELGPSGIRVNGVAPGLVGTPRVLNGVPAAAWAATSAANPLRRHATPTDVAKALLYLSSDLSSYLNGNILRLDGGSGNIGIDVPFGRP